MNWLDIALIVTNVANGAMVVYFSLRLHDTKASRKRWIDLAEKHLARACNLANALMTHASAKRYYANPQAWQSPERGKHSDAFRDRGERAREALDAARKILEEGK